MTHCTCNSSNGTRSLQECFQSKLSRQTLLQRGRRHRLTSCLNVAKRNQWYKAEANYLSYAFTKNTFSKSSLLPYYSNTKSAPFQHGALASIAFPGKQSTGKTFLLFVGLCFLFGFFFYLNISLPP